MKSNQASFPTIMLWDQKSATTEKLQKHKQKEAKQYATKQPMDHWRNQRRNLKNIWGQMKIKTQQSKICGTQQK